MFVLHFFIFIGKPNYEEEKFKIVPGAVTFPNLQAMTEVNIWLSTVLVDFCKINIFRRET